MSMLAPPPSEILDLPLIYAAFGYEIGVSPNHLSISQLSNYYEILN